MKIGFIGLGKLGMPCALAINQKGHDVIGYDVNPQCMQKDSFPHKEIGPNGEESIEPLLKESTIQFGTLEDVVKQSEIIFVPIQTPHEAQYEGITRIPKHRKDFNYQHLIKGINDISKVVDKIEEDRTVVIISTVLPGTVRKYLLPIMSKRIKLCYNPFFIAMGTTMRDFLNPEFVLFGVHDDEAAIKAEEFYKTIHNRPFYKTTIENAELIKVAYNTFIGMKIAFVNTLMEICHHSLNTNVDAITDALKLATDRLISTSYLSAGMGDGGGCHPRDNIALSWLAQELDLKYDWFEGVMMAREKQTEFLADLIEKIYKEKNFMYSIHILGKAFKPETNLTTGSPAILLANILKERGIKVNHEDPIIDGHDCISSPNTIYFIATKHEVFKTYVNQFPKGSIVIDPFRYLDFSENPDVTYIPVGIGEVIN